MWPSVLAQRREWIGVIATYLAALVVRLQIWDVNFWIDESAVYHTARTAGAPVDHVYNEEAATPAGLNTRWLFWQRPLHSLLLWPGAAISPAGFRLWFIVLASLLPPLVLLLLRSRRARPAIAYAGGAILCLAPGFVVFGVYGLPDTLMLCALVGSFLAHERKRPILAGILLLTAVWIKEFAFVLVVALLGLLAWRILRQWRTPLGPQLTRFDVLLLFVGVIGLWPLLYALSMGAPFPGWFRGGTYEQILDRSFLVFWLAPVVLAGLAWQRTRKAAIVGLTYPTFFVLYHMAGRGVAHSYFLASSLFALVAAALVVDEAWTRFGTTRQKRAAIAAAAILLLAPLASHIALPEANPTKRMLNSPFTQDLDPSLPRVLALARQEGGPFVEALKFAEAGPWTNVFLIDATWHDPYHPDLAWAQTVRLGFPHYADGHPDYLSRIVPVMENMTDIAILVKTQNAGNTAILRVYADCILFENPGAAVIDGPACPGRLEELEREYSRIRHGT